MGGASPAAPDTHTCGLGARHSHALLQVAAVHGQEGEAADCQHDGCAGRHLRQADAEKGSNAEVASVVVLLGSPDQTLCRKETELLMLLGNAECCWEAH